MKRKKNAGGFRDGTRKRVWKGGTCTIKELGTIPKDYQPIAPFPVYFYFEHDSDNNELLYEKQK